MPGLSLLKLIILSHPELPRKKVQFFCPSIRAHQYLETFFMVLITPFIIFFDFAIKYPLLPLNYPNKAGQAPRLSALPILGRLYDGYFTDPVVFINLSIWLMAWQCQNSGRGPARFKPGHAEKNFFGLKFSF